MDVRSIEIEKLLLWTSRSKTVVLKTVYGFPFLRCKLRFIYYFDTCPNYNNINLRGGRFKFRELVWKGKVDGWWNIISELKKYLKIFQSCLEPKITISLTYFLDLWWQFSISGILFASLISFLVYHKLLWHVNLKWLMLFLCPLKIEMARQKHRLDFHCSGSLSGKTIFFF